MSKADEILAGSKYADTGKHVFDFQAQTFGEIYQFDDAKTNAAAAIMAKRLAGALELWQQWDESTFLGASGDKNRDQFRRGAKRKTKQVISDYAEFQREIGGE